MGLLNKRATIQEILDEYGHFDWCIVRPNKLYRLAQPS